MFGVERRKVPRAEPGTVGWILAVVAVLLAIQGAVLVVVATPIEQAVVAAREPLPARRLVRVPEYTEEIQVVGPPRWERDLLRELASRRADPVWFADQATPVVCPVSSR